MAKAAVAEEATRRVAFVTGDATRSIHSARRFAEIRRIEKSAGRTNAHRAVPKLPVATRTIARWTGQIQRGFALGRAVDTRISVAQRVIQNDQTCKQCNFAQFERRERRIYRC